MPNNWLHAHNRISYRADDFQSDLSCSPKSLPSFDRLVSWEGYIRLTIPIFARHALFSIVKDTKLSIRHGVSVALGIGQDRRGVHAPTRIDTGLLPSHNGRSTDIHIQGRSMERNCARQQACSISRFFGCASIIFHSNEYIQK